MGPQSHDNSFKRNMIIFVYCQSIYKPSKDVKTFKYIIMTFFVVKIVALLVQVKKEMISYLLISLDVLFKF